MANSSMRPLLILLMIIPSLLTHILSDSHQHLFYSVLSFRCLWEVVIGVDSLIRDKGKKGREEV